MSRKKAELAARELPFEAAVKDIHTSGKSLEKLAAEEGMAVEQLQATIDAYHRALDDAMELDKAERKTLFKYFKELGKELKRTSPGSDFMLLHDLRRAREKMREGTRAIGGPLPGTTSIISQEDVRPS